MIFLEHCYVVVSLVGIGDLLVAFYPGLATVAKHPAVLTHAHRLVALTGRTSVKLKVLPEK